MKKLLVLPFVLLLSGCVTYYYPKTAMKDGIYYAEDDPSYVVNSDAMYYPWVSLDYFYLAYYPTYYHPYYSRWNVYHYYYPVYPVRRSYDGNCMHAACSRKDRKNRRARKNDRFAGSDGGARSSRSRSAKSGARGRSSRSMTRGPSHRINRASSRINRE